MKEKLTCVYLWGTDLSVEILCPEKYDILEYIKIYKNIWNILKYIKFMIEKLTCVYLWGTGLSVEILCPEKYDILEQLERIF